MAAVNIETVLDELYGAETLLDELKALVKLHRLIARRIDLTARLALQVCSGAAVAKAMGITRQRIYQRFPKER